ncbi:MAG: cytochrome c [Gammaproteobacteria bacterium]|nr:cytochrome c [Gammaproteobacteria bacterium]
MYSPLPHNPVRAVGRRAVSPPLASLILFLMLIALPGGKAPAETGKKPDPHAALRGAKLYKNFCQSCHGKRGVGETVYPWNVGKPGYFPAPALDDSQHAWHHSDEDLAKFIREGSPRTPRMPAWKKNLSEQNIRDIVAYMKSLWGNRALECQGPKHMSCM